MSKKKPDRSGAETSISHDDYEAQLQLLQIELVKLQRHVIRHGKQLLVLLEGRDAAGKDGNVKRLVEYLSPRETRVIALAAPCDRERGAWYFQRYVAQLPVAGEIVFFNRSWYNRAGVERVMGFCSKSECEAFLQATPRFEALLVQSGVQLLKYYLDIDRDTQIERLADRAHDPLAQWKRSAIDAVAVKHWKTYSAARDTMLARTDNELAPWTIVRGNDKMLARLNLMRDLLSRVDYAGKKKSLLHADPALVFEFTPECITAGALAP
jgi:polyphosphate kinase 2